MDRRTFLALASGAAAWPSLPRAQGSRKLPRIGMAAFPPLQSLASEIAGFEKGLREEGLVPGRDVLLDFRSANLDPARYREVVRDLVRSKPDVIITGINANTAAVRAETGTIPIVMTVGVDPVGEGFIKSLSRPGANITGLTYDVGAESWLKRFEVFKLAVPSISRVAVLYDADQGTANTGLIEAAARSIGLESLLHDIGDDFQEAFSIAGRWRANAALFFSGARQYARRADLVAMTLKYRLPSNFPQVRFVEAGGLMSYGPNIADSYRRAAGYVSRILKGAKPGDLPVQQPIVLELAINLKTAKALGLAIPREVLLRADRVIE
jgi:putative ABC transport system substrate-binding protein